MQQVNNIFYPYMGAYRIAPLVLECGSFHRSPTTKKESDTHGHGSV
jgi:hypothetical protein